MRLDKTLIILCMSALSSLFSPLIAQTAPRQPMSEGEFIDALQDVSKRAFLGIQFVFQQEPGNDPTRYRLKIRAVQPGGPGDKAGMRPDDAIVAVDGRPLVFNDPLEIEFFFDPVAPGQTMKLGVLRGKETLDLALTAAELPPELTRAKVRDRRRVLMGAGVETAEKLGRDEGTPLRLEREADSGRLTVELLGKAQRLSPLRLEALAVAFEDSQLFPRAREIRPGAEGAFRLRYDSATTTFNLDPMMTK